MARDDVVATMDRWHEIKESRRQSPQPDDPSPANVTRIAGWPVGKDTDVDAEMTDRLVGSIIMLLRAIEEVEARPWWRRRRYNPYAR